MEKKTTEKKTGKKNYTLPKVDTMTVRELEAAVGPVQGLSSGAPASPSPTRKLQRGGRGHGHGRGHRG